jgi:hypothetical protein
MKFEEFENMAPNERREFLKALSLFTLFPFAPSGLKEACQEILLGKKAYAQSAVLPRYFIEINLRDQFDWTHLFVPPGIATGNITRGFSGDQVGLAQSQDSLVQEGNNFYLPDEGQVLRPHLDDIAVLETCELSVGPIHGHEGGNATRSPGRGYNSGPGREKMYLKDPNSKLSGNGDHYSSSPTPANIHNYVCKKADPSLKNGVIYKGISRSIHTVYHYSGNLAGADPDRYQSTSDLEKAFSTSGNGGATPNYSRFSNQITQLIKKVDKNYLNNFRYDGNAHSDHEKQLQGVQKRLASTGPGGLPANFQLALSSAERNHWRSDFPETGRGGSKAWLWEQAGLATKLITNDIVRTVALEFDYVDVHGDRPEKLFRAQAKQVSNPLSKMIEALKTAGIWNETVVAIFTTDGGRGLEANSFGSKGKNGAILAGGQIKGGYYGNVTNQGTKYFYHRPDDSGRPIANGVSGNDKRVAGRDLWMTLMQALRMDMNLARSFPDTKDAKILDYMLKS